MYGGVESARARWKNHHYDDSSAAKFNFCNVFATVVDFRRQVVVHWRRERCSRVFRIAFVRLSEFDKSRGLLHGYYFD